MPKPCLHYALRSEKSVRDEVVRVLGELAARGQFLAGGLGEPGEELVHEGRVLIKRARALIWLARPALGATACAKSRDQLRKAAGMLAGQRDRVAVRMTLETLRREMARKRDEAHLVRICGGESEGPISGAGEGVISTGTFREAMGMVCASVGELRQWAAAREEWPSPRKRVDQAARAAERAGRKARESKSDDDFHTWRKKAKRLLYLLELTHPHPSRHMGRVITLVEKLQNKLGLYHDRVVTEQRLRTMDPLPSSARRVLQLLSQSKKRVGKKARKLKRRLGRL
jgi:CHAD domain-containing protein